MERETHSAEAELDRRIRRSRDFIFRYDHLRLLVIAAVLVGALLSPLARAASTFWGAELGGNVAAELLGIVVSAVVAVALVERILEHRRDRAWNEVRDLEAQRFAAILYEAITSLHSALRHGAIFQYGGGALDPNYYIAGLYAESQREMFADSNAVYHRAMEGIRDPNRARAWDKFDENADEVLRRLVLALDRFSGRLPARLEASLLAVENALEDTHRVLAEIKMIRNPPENVPYPDPRAEASENFLARTCSRLWEATRSAAEDVFAELDVDPAVLLEADYAAHRTGSRLVELDDG